MQFENILYSVNDGVATLTLNRQRFPMGLMFPCVRNFKSH